MTDPLLKSIATERAALRARLRVLDEFEERVKKAPRVNGMIVMQPHAPHGALRQALLSVLQREKKPRFSEQLRARVIADGYEHPINIQYFTKTLRGLVEEKVVAKEENGRYSTYWLRK